jgi:hypothetical protein
MQMAEKANAKPRVRRTYKQLFLDELKKLSGGEQKIINNNTLRDALNWKEGRYKRIKDELADEKVIAATRGGKRQSTSTASCIHFLFAL